MQVPSKCLAGSNLKRHLLPCARQKCFLGGAVKSPISNRTLCTVRFFFPEHCWSHVERLITRVSLNESWLLQKGILLWENSFGLYTCKGSLVFVNMLSSLGGQSETCHQPKVILIWRPFKDTRERLNSACWYVPVIILQERNVRQTLLMGNVVYMELWVMPSDVCWRSTNRSRQSAWRETTMMSSCSGKQMGQLHVQRILSSFLSC